VDNSPPEDAALLEDYLDSTRGLRTDIGPTNKFLVFVLSNYLILYVGTTDEAVTDSAAATEDDVVAALQKRNEELEAELASVKLR
jgi:glycerol-3-phosphate dehydrogenase